MSISIQRIKIGIKKHQKLYKITTAIYKKAYKFVRDHHFIYKITLKIGEVFNRSQKLDIYHVNSLKAFCEINNLVFKVVEKSQNREVYEPEYFDNIEPEKMYLIKSPEIYITEILDVDIIGENSFLLKGKSLLYDMAKIENSDRYDLRFSSLKSISRNNEALVLSMESNIVIDEGIFLVGFGAFNYFHLTFELLCKLKYVDEKLEYSNVPILIDEIVWNIPQFRQLLDSLNKFNRVIIPLKKGTKYKISKLIYPSDYTWLPINVKDSVKLINDDFRIAKSGMKYIREMILAKKDEPVISEGKLKLFISRRKQYMQRLVNEKEIAEMFQQFGFQMIYPEELSFDEQVDLFSKAKYVAGTSGAALTNILFCPEKAVLICIIPQEYNFNLYATIGKHIGVESIFLDAKVIEKNPKISSDKFFLDTKYCQEFLKTLKD